MNGAVAFTWSPDPKIFNGKRPKFQYNDTIHYIRLIDKCGYYRMYPELNLQGNIHYHGVVQVLDFYKWYKSVLPSLKLNGFVCIKASPDSKWDDYIKKDQELMEKLLNIKLPLIWSEAEKKNKQKRRVTKIMLDEQEKIEMIKLKQEYEGETFYD